MKSPQRPLAIHRKQSLRTTIPRLGGAALALLTLSAPWLLFFDPIPWFRNGHIPLDPLESYRLLSDDFAYVSGSRTLERTLENLFVPHNTHIVPAWRLLTWALVSASGKLSRIPETLAVASYAILVAVMVLMGRLVARESGRTCAGFAAAALVGTSSLMLAPATWYSASQPLWAGYAILAALWYAQNLRRGGTWRSVGLCAVAAAIAGWFWTVGYLAGPVASLYLWLDGRRRCRRLAAIPSLASVAAVVIASALGAAKIDSTVSFHGRTATQAADPLQGLLHTAQAIPENLIFANLGLRARTTQAQGLILSSLFVAAWIRHRRLRGGRLAFTPLECAGAFLVFSSYLIEWTVRGYLDFDYLRTLSQIHIVPWYDAIPWIGGVLFGFGWWCGPGPADRGDQAPRRAVPLSLLGGLAVTGLVTTLIVLQRPRVELLWRNSVPPLVEAELSRFPIVELKSMRAHLLLLERAAWQRRHLRRLDLAQDLIDRLGIDLATVKQAFGRLDMPELPEVYDAAGLLRPPTRVRSHHAEEIQRGLSPLIFLEREPMPPWIPPGVPWPPRQSADDLRTEFYGSK